MTPASAVIVVDRESALELFSGRIEIFVVDLAAAAAAAPLPRWRIR